jgi:cytochrome c556
MGKVPPTTVEFWFMTRFSKVTALAAISFASFAFVANSESHSPMMGQEGAEAVMKGNGGAVGALSKMAKGEIPFDAVAAEAAKQALIKGAQDTVVVFKEPFDGEETLPAIWENYDDFTAKAKALEDAAAALDVTSTDTIGAGLGPVGGACGACHQLYRAKS